MSWTTDGLPKFPLDLGCCEEISITHRTGKMPGRHGSHPHNLFVFTQGLYSQQKAAPRSPTRPHFLRASFDRRAVIAHE